ncbi:hypothetical protein Ancab_001968 [Ancistrocladus abbreviatus]
MMFSRFEYENNPNDSDSSNGQFLRDIEEISKALYLHRNFENCLIPSSSVRSTSTEKTHFPIVNLKSKPGFIEGDWFDKDKKSSVWQWRPLKALSHIWQRKLNCYFFFHVHFIENLPSSFNDLSLCVHWRRKDYVMTTSPSRVSDGVVEFEETLVNSSSVYATRSGPGNFMKYDPKHFLLYASVDGVMRVDIGKHWIDLTRLLPLTFEELEENKSSGRWATSFKLAGHAKGATLHVSVGFLVMRDNFVEFGSHTKSPPILKLKKSESCEADYLASSGDGKGGSMLRRVASVPCSLTHESPNSSQSPEVKVLPEVLPNNRAELSSSISLLYRKLHEENMTGSADFDFAFKQLELVKSVPYGTGKDCSGNESDCVEYSLTEKGIELECFAVEKLMLEEPPAGSMDISTVEVIDVEEIFKGEDIATEATKLGEKEKNGAGSVSVALLNEPNYVSVEESNVEEVGLDFLNAFISETTELESSLSKSQFLVEHIPNEDELDHESKEMVKSQSLDDVIEAVVSDFFNLLEETDARVASSSDCDQESPREHLWREFEENILDSGSLFLDSGLQEEEPDFSFAVPSSSFLENPVEDTDFFPAIGAHGAEVECKREKKSTRSKTKAKMLERLETQSLMQRWGLNEEVFQSSPHNSTGGFGSPIFVPHEESVQLPLLVEGLSSLILLNGGGLLRPISPTILRNAKDEWTLIMQTSRPIVLPAAMGSDIMEVLQSMASTGAERLSEQAHKLMPLEEVSGEMLQQLSQEASSRTEEERMVFSQHGSDFKPEVGGFPFASSHNNLYRSSKGEGGGLQCMSIEDLAPLAMDRIEILSIEGLRIQCGTSDKEAPSSISLKSNSEVLAFELKICHHSPSTEPEEATGVQCLSVMGSITNVEGLMDLSVSLNDWLRLDAGDFDDGDQIDEHTLKVLAAHHARPWLLDTWKLARDESWENAPQECGLFPNNLTVAFMLQLRNPLRNYEPVGAPMLAIVQVERTFGCPIPAPYCKLSEERSAMEGSQYETPEKVEWMECKLKDENSLEVIWGFRMNKVHLTGLNVESGNQEWATRRQQQSASRWLIASGMNNMWNSQFSKSNAIVRFSPQAIRKFQRGNFLWSISLDVHGVEDAQEELVADNAYKRNPDIIFVKQAL